MQVDIGGAMRALRLVPAGRPSLWARAATAALRLRAVRAGLAIRGGGPETGGRA